MNQVLSPFEERSKSTENFIKLRTQGSEIQHSRQENSSFHLIHTLPDHILNSEQRHKRQLQNEQKMLQYRQFTRELDQKKQQIRKELNLGRKKNEKPGFPGQQM